jgi:carboxyl-terminal processing protease
MGELTGVGVELLVNDDGTTTINNIEEDSPAKESSLKKGDIIVNIDGTDAKGLSPEEIAATIRGKAGTKASIRILRDGTELDFSIVRRPFKLKSVLWSIININGKPCGIITIKSFSDKTSDDVTKAMEAFHKNTNLNSIIIDMRNNGGGLLQGAVETAALFMNPGKIVVFEITKEGLVDAKQTLPSSIKSNDDDLPDTTTPLYVLVNSNTASAAEVLAAALKENGRGKLVGEKTFGKGIIIIIIITIIIIIIKGLFKHYNN